MNFHGVRHVKRWWMTGAADRKLRRLSVSLYDQGISIPVSLPATWGAQRLAEMFQSLFNKTYDPQHPSYDGEAIEAAVAASKSSTGLSHRGLGLPKIQAAVEKFTGGRLRILSRHGEYLVKTGEKPVLRSCNTPLHGTLVEIEATF